MGRPVNSRSTGMNGAKNGGGIRVTRPITKSTTSTSTQSSKGGKGLDIGKSTADRSQLNFPYDIRLSGFTSLQNAATKGTPRIRRILMEECDYIMECRICRNLFRTVPNFVTHKMNYCKKAFDSTFCLGLSNLIPTSDSEFKIQYEVDPELLLDDNSSDDTPNVRSVADFYSELSERAKAKAEISSSGQPGHQLTPSPPSKENVVRLQIKPLVETSNGSVVVQQRTTSDPSNCDKTSKYVNPFQKLVQKDTAILGPDGKAVYVGSKKGIEQVLAKLTARMRAAEEKQMQSSQSTNSTAVSCDICKTVFDSEKAVRQHKRESPDCCKTWPFKSPVKRSESYSNSSTNLSPNRSEPSNSQREKEAIDENEVRKLQDTKVDASGSPRLPKSPTRRLSYKKIFQSPTKTQRGLSLSPVKKIKMKYSKFDSGSIGGGGGGGEGGIPSFSCTRCSSSFVTKHEMSMHLALCSGVINYAALRERDSPVERITISARHEFVKSSGTQKLSKCESTEPKDIPNCTPSTASLLPSSSNPRAQTSTKPDDLSSSLQLKEQQRKRQAFGGKPNRDDLQEVNNNKQYKSSAEITEKVASISTLMNEPELPEGRRDGVEGSTDFMDLDLSRSDEASLDTDSGVSSEFPGSVQNDQIDTSQTKKVAPPVVKSRKRKPKVNLVGQATSRLEGKTHKSHKPFNLRKTVRLRVRKSGRNHENSKRRK